MWACCALVLFFSVLRFHNSYQNSCHQSNDTNNVCHCNACVQEHVASYPSCYHSGFNDQNNNVEYNRLFVIFWALVNAMLDISEEPNCAIQQRYCRCYNPDQVERECHEHDNFDCQSGQYGQSEDSPIFIGEQFFFFHVISPPYSKYSSASAKHGILYYITILAFFQLYHV